jgi:hypothetical protein
VKTPDKNWSHDAVLKYWISERSKIADQRRHGVPWPWTKDIILQTYAFTNVTRHLDTTTIFLRGFLKALKVRDQMINIVAFRMFNRINTWERIAGMFTPKYDRQAVYVTLKDMSEHAEAITSSCWLVSGSGAKGRKIYDLQLDAVDEATKDLDNFMNQRDSLEHMHEYLRSLPRVGPFVAHEMLQDMTYESRVLERAVDRKSFVYLGPGAVRYLRRERKAKDPPTNLFGDNDQEDLDHFRQVAKRHMYRRLDNGYQLTIHDVEHCLCEAEKYIQALNGAGLKRRYKRIQP